MTPTEHLIVRAAGGFKKHVVVRDKDGRVGAALCGFKPSTKRTHNRTQKRRRACWTTYVTNGHQWCAVCFAAVHE